MKNLRKAIVAIIFALVLVQILVLVYSKTGARLTDFALISTTGAAAGLYYLIFERKRKAK